MSSVKRKILRDDGWTFIEATLSVVLLTIMVLGLSIVLMAFREHLNRSWAVRTMDQYGNDVIERLTHHLRNAVDVNVRPGARNTNRIDIKFLDPYVSDLFHTVTWRADTRTARIMLNNDPIDEKFPPPRLGRKESYEIVEFTLKPFGTDAPVRQWDRNDRFQRNKKFIDATWDINFTLRYTRKAMSPGQRDWSFEKVYNNRVYMRNKNLIVQKGITG